MNDQSDASRPSVIDRMFNFFENKKPSDRLLLKITAVVLFIALIWFVLDLNSSATESVPGTGGTLTEGVVGTPRFINPVLALTRADKDVTALVYSGLMRLDEKGEIVPYIANSITVSDDGLTYNVVLRQDIVFHDGEKVTADDVIFTVGLIKEPNLKSPLQTNFDRVFVEKIGDYEVNFVLEEPFAAFIETLTFGILPKHVWQAVSVEQFPFSQNNTEPVGSGTYQIERVSRNTSGLIRSYELKSFENPIGTPNIDKIVLSFFASEADLVKSFNKGEIDSVAGLSAENTQLLDIYKVGKIITKPLPRTFALFFNQNKSTVLLDSAVREALSVAIDRDALVENILFGYGEPIYSPIPPSFGPTSTTTDTDVSEKTSAEKAKEILEGGGWKQNEDEKWIKEIDEVEMTLAVDISTANSDIFDRTSNFIREAWEEVGIEVTVRQFEQSDLTQTVIRPRNYQILLFGTAVGRQLDFYSFWHSLGRTDPGLNVALYANIAVDGILEDLRTEPEPNIRNKLLMSFEKEILKDTPAVFLFVPQFTYIIPKNLNVSEFEHIAHPSERFSNIDTWNISTDSLWPIFNNVIE